ncbi:FtsQ-type POTRA domain-containing protein [Marisediminicola senii]|uniref:FtsQ-type POTRA domain-containing protein n=1 Tax=Marisediminicola senii TaxID=2711233 RepID=UPI00191156B2|nr:FtsQ-type POTRA domain-containing protein [Marisediminicola senii]
MKRPDGFDRPAENDEPRGGRRGLPSFGDLPGLPFGRKRRGSTAAEPASESDRTTGSMDAARPGSPDGAGSPERPSTLARPSTLPRGPVTPEPTPERDERAARRDVRRAARQHRRFERGEVRRFTRRSRRRRIGWSVALGMVATMAILVGVAVYSPLLALRTIEIEGTSRIDEVALYDAVDDQLDTPLALIDFDQLERELGAFPLIRSYVTETVPPNTLIINVVERQPIGSLPSGSGFAMVDPAGIVIERSEERMPGVPLIEIAGQDAGSPAFEAAVEVLLALPDSILTQLDTVTAATRDDVRLTMSTGGAQIVWGSADDSDYKARVLAVALAQNYPNVTEYNVSAPGQFTWQ